MAGAEMQLTTKAISPEMEVMVIDSQFKEGSEGQVNLPTIHYFQSDKSEISLGKSIILEWSVEGADKVWLEPEIGEMASSKGEIEVYPTESTYFILRAENSSGAISEVVELILPKPEIAYFHITEDHINIGYPTILHWEVKNASSVFINKGVGHVNPNLSFVEAMLEVPGPCTITAQNPSGSVSKTIELSLPLPAIYEFGARKPMIEEHTPVVLTWDISNAKQIFIDQGIGEVTDQDKVELIVDRTTTYTLTAVNYAGSVQAVSTVLLPPPIIRDFDSDSEIVTEEEPTVKLKWEVEHAYEITINQGIGNVTGKESVVVQPKEAITLYTLTCRGHSGVSTAEIQIRKFPIPIEAQWMDNIENHILTDPLQDQPISQDRKLDLEGTFAEMQDELSLTMKEIKKAQKGQKKKKKPSEPNENPLPNDFMELRRPRMRDELKDIFQTLKKKFYPTNLPNQKIEDSHE
ncbi:MAG: hypothetical protein AAF824_12790 [Bacteroidota bacterium]